MRPLSPRRPVTGLRGTRHAWQHAFSDISYAEIQQKIFRHLV